MPKIVLVVLALAALAGCNTMKGAGHDVSNAGSAISNEAAETQQKM